MIGGHGMTPENQIRTVTGLSKFWDGDPIPRVRGGDGAKVLYGRRLSMHLMAQPVVVASLMNNEVLLGQGILSRVLPTFPTSTAGSRLYRSVDLSRDPAILKFNARIRQIIEANLPMTEGTRNELEPRPLVLSTQAKRIWVGFHDTIESQLGCNGDLAPVKGFAAKIAEHALRLAGTLTLFEDLGAAEIRDDAIVGGIDLAQFYLAEALRLYNSSVTSPEILQAELLLDWAKKQGEFVYLPHVYQYGPNSIRDAKTARKLIEILERHGWLTRLTEGMEIGGKMRREAWRVWRADVQTI